MDMFVNLGVALALGLLVGTERGWQERTSGEGQRVAGLRTFGLIGLLGALSAMLSDHFGTAVLAVAFLAFAALVSVAYAMNARHERSFGATTEVAALVTFALGALAAFGQLALAAAAAVVTTILLGLKPVLHRGLEHLERRELYATFKLLLISLVLLPILPNAGYGPWNALNPYKIWLLVVLIAGISYVGYFAVKLVGAHRGLVITALFGGLASSTAVTLSFSRMGQTSPALHSLLAAGVVMAAATMFPRVLVEVAVVNRDLLPLLVVPIGAMTVAAYATVPLLLRAARGTTSGGEVPLSNPFELGPALKFGALLVAVMLLSKAAQQWFGDAGVYLLAAVSGISDVDAITLSLAQLAKEEMDNGVAARAIVIAAMVNTLVKTLLVVFIARGAMAMRVGVVAALTLAAGAIGLLWVGG